MKKLQRQAASPIIYSYDKLAIWFLSPNPFTAISYFLGASLGTAYCYGLGKYVETLGGSAYEAEDVKGSGKDVGLISKSFMEVILVILMF